MNLINILAEVSQTGKQRHIPYRDFRLTFLLRESLGGNAKLAMICAVSPVQSTLRFAQHAKAIKNKAVVNKVMQDDVNYLHEVIQQLRDELHRVKANGQNLTHTNGGCSAGWACRSLNILKLSLHHPMTLPHIDDDGDEEMEIDEDTVEKSVTILSANSHVRDSSVQPSLEKKTLGSSVSGLPDTGSLSNSVRHGSSCPIFDPLVGFSREILGEDMPDESGNGSVNCVFPSCLSIVRTDVSPVLKSPTLSVHPELTIAGKA
ncbi:hypothetical protein Patl1_23624 [Pistacia atlantica]|uniref:Uncharacterized protein n=1 Tax=Pistacia atlantica TaxID=434234 RepID=A0ACC0ZYM5_9ROSI|nr:hypothetical protein Patl1_23624 [Pistacia atlantica]